MGVLELLVELIDAWLIRLGLRCFLMLWLST